MPASCSETPGPRWAADACSGEVCCLTSRMLREVGAFLLGGMAAIPCAWSSREGCVWQASDSTASSLRLGLGLSGNY